MKNKIYYAISLGVLILILSTKVLFTSLNLDLVLLFLLPTLVIFLQIHYDFQRRIIFAIVFSFILLITKTNYHPIQILMVVGGSCLSLSIQSIVNKVIKEDL